MRQMRQFKIDCLLVALVDIGFEVNERFHGFGLTIQSSDENRQLPLRNTMDINILHVTEAKT